MRGMVRLSVESSILDGEGNIRSYLENWPWEGAIDEYEDGNWETTDLKAMDLGKITITDQDVDEVIKFHRNRCEKHYCIRTDHFENPYPGLPTSCPVAKGEEDEDDDAEPADEAPPLVM